MADICPVVTQTTLSVREILKLLLRDVRLHLNISDQDTPSAVMIDVHDWLAYLCGSDTICHEYALPFISGESYTSPSPCDGWIRKITGSDASVSTLLYRHYVSRKAVESMIYENTTMCDGLYLSMRSTIYDGIRFSPIETEAQAFRLSDTASPIVELRASRHRRLIELDALANSCDITPYALDRQHGTLSSMMVLHTLGLIQAIVACQARIHRTDDLEDLSESISTAISRIHGVVFDA
jgi:hypothetical protein